MILRKIVICSLLCIANFSHAGLNGDEISKEETTGSNIKKSRKWNGIPLDKRYADLSLAEKAIVHADYEKIKEGDEPPYPLKGMRSIIDPIHKIINRVEADGNLEFVLTVNTKGEGENVEIISSPSPELTNLVASVLMLTKYKPAICDGQPCTMQLPLRLGISRHFK